MPVQVAGLTAFSPPGYADANFVADMLAGFPHHLCIRPAVQPAAASVLLLDLDYHVRYSALPRPGSERELGVLVSRLHSRPLDFTRPIWEFHIIEGWQTGASRCS